ncbi:ferredoxin [Penicillium malachiteum]|uniref:Ferredoxin n=1 Tax=Penicillium malachiteum TaxID=1324776 RepID=A0AAD6MVW0_9EURO|nr:ferredoxin [Penicillium malachiteum]
MPEYKITLKTPDGDKTFQCNEDIYIQDAAEDKGIEPPYSCRAGACSTCTALLISGTVDHADQSFLENEQIEQNFVLLYVAYPMSDCVLSTNKEDELW